jgi:methionyl-tRNA synthetase
MKIKNNTLQELDVHAVDGNTACVTNQKTYKHTIPFSHMTTEDMIHFEDWEKIDLRVGKIEKVEEHPKAEKLYILTVNFNTEIGIKTIVAGLKEYCSKEHLEGKSAIFITNLEPKTIRGIESQGMILAATSPDKSHVCILTPDLKDIPEGSKIS